jgi:hypothetical protein
MGELGQPQPTISVGGISEADLMEARMGSNGNPTYEEQFGTTSAPLGSVGVTQPTLAELELEAQKALARAINPLGYAGQGQPQDYAPNPDFNVELEKFKKLYGESENEKGQLRKNQQELMEAFNGLMAQYEALQASPQPQQWSPQVMPNQFGPMPYGPAQPQFADPFEGVQDADYVDGKTMRNVVERAVGQATAFAVGQAQQALQRQSILEQKLAQQARAASGISKLDEYRLAAKNPWLNQLPDAQRFAAIQSLKAAEGVAAPQAPAVQAPQQNDSQSRILNRVTYIEGSNPTVPDQTEAALEAAKQRDYAIVMSANAEDGTRARLFRQFGVKYGLSIGQAPSDLAR